MSTKTVFPLVLLGALALSVVVGALAFRSRHDGRAEAPAPGESAAAAEARARLEAQGPAPWPPPPVVPAPPAVPVATTTRRPTPEKTPRADAATSPADEAALMAKLRSLAGTNPQLILQLAREANARSPDSPDAPERAWMVVKSLVDLQRLSEAKDEAQTMVNRYPGTSWALDVQRHLLSNPLQ